MPRLGRLLIVAKGLLKLPNLLMLMKQGSVPLARNLASVKLVELLMEKYVCVRAKE